MKSIFLTVALSLGVFLGFAQDAATLINNANEALAGKDYAKAFELYESAMKNLGDVQVDDAINFNIGFAALQADKFESALDYFDKAIAANVNVSNSWVYKGNALAKLDRYDDAIAAYRKAIEAGAEDKGSVYYNAGIVAYNGKKFEQAADLFANAAAENYNADNAYYYRALSLRKMDKDEEYKQTLIEGAEKFPQEKKITSALANVYVLEGNALYKKGVKIINAANAKVKAGSLKTDDAAYAAELEKSKVEFKAALEILEKAQTLDASNDNAAKLIGACNSVL